MAVMKHRAKQQLLLFSGGLLSGIILGLVAAPSMYVSFGPTSSSFTERNEASFKVSKSELRSPYKNPSAEPALEKNEGPDESKLATGTRPCILSQPAETKTLELPSGESPELVRRTLAVEQRFAAAIKSCLGGKCIDERPKGAGRDRVLITALPHSGGEVLFRLLSLLAAQEKGAPEVVFSERVLPYGYGRNFGFNRVIKLVARPLWNIAAIKRADGRAASKAGEAALAVQYLRWHCRQKVGHTRSLVAFSDELIKRRPFFELERAASFAGLKPDRRRLLAALEKEGLGIIGARPAGKSSGATAAVRDQAAAIGEEPWPMAPGLLDIGSLGSDLAPWPPTLDAETAATLVGALEGELDRSDNLQKWPCGTMRGGDSVLGDRLLPNCSLPFVDCFVNHDSSKGEHVN